MLPERSGSELVFGVLRELMRAYQLWGVQSSLELAALCGFIGASDRHVRRVLAYLSQEGLVALDHATDTVRLTESGARNLLSHPREA